MMTHLRNALTGAALLAVLLTGTGNTAGLPENKPTFQKNHPRQTEVLNRVDRERHRVNKLYKDGKISAEQRGQLLSQIHGVRKEDYSDAKANSPDGKVRSGYITKDQQRVMNQQESQIKREIRQDLGK